ncbi:MAG: hypothetical protein KGS61_15150, partial [Verrucomicrobia bacterium]|nr:hypothetical protein [Verrucomicrobiota bacterium]
VALKDTSGNSYTNTSTFTVPVYGTIPADYATTQADTTSSGFVVRTFAMDAQRGPGDMNSIPNAEEQLVGGFLDPSTGLPYPNTAILTGATNGVFYVTNYINFEINGGDINANPPQPDHFNSGNNYPNVFFPGIPSSNVTQPTTEDFACEITTYLSLKRGYYRMGVNSDDGFAVSVAPGEADVAGLRLGDFATGRGSSDTTFDFVVTQDGIYPFRLSYWQGTGGGNLEWWTKDLQTGAYHLVNDRTDSSALIAYSSGHARGHFESISPANGFAGCEPTNHVVAMLQDDLTSIQQNSIAMTIDGNAVTPTISKNAGLTTVTYIPAQPFAFNSSHAGTLVYQESTTPPTTWTNTFSFVVRLQTPNDLPTNSFWIESEDWDFGGGQTLPVASIMPYGGGAYQTSGTDTTKFDIDYHNDDHGLNNATSSLNEDEAYRSGGDLDLTDSSGNHYQSVDTTDNANNRYGTLRPGGFVMTDDWRIGWINSGDWGNYTRTIPPNVYNVFAAMSHGDAAGTLHDERGSLQLVTSGWGTKNQSLVTLGSFDGPASGGWGVNTLVKMQSSDGSDAVIKLGGTNTLRFNADSGDFDWFVLAPTVAPAKVMSASPVASVHGEPRNTPIDVVVANLSTSVATNTVKLSVNGQDVTSSIIITVNAGMGGNGSTVSIHYQPPQLLALGTNGYTLTFADNGTPPKTTTYTATFIVDPRATPNQFLIEAEDFDFGGGQSTNIASTMPYLGGAYQGLSAKFGVDYYNNDGLDSQAYRWGGDLNMTNSSGAGIQNVDTDATGDVYRGSWTNTVNFKVGWIDSADWFNYTRTFPANTYQVWVALSHGDPAGTAHRLLGSIGLVTSGVGTTNQTVQVLGSCDAPSTGTWGLNNLVPMTNTNGVPIVVQLGGTETVQFQGNSGDYDYLLFVPSAPAGPQFSKIQVSGSNLIITWSGAGTLQQAASPSGSWSAVSGASSPATVPIGGSKSLYFRIQQ